MNTRSRKRDAVEVSVAPARRTADAASALRASLIEHALRIVRRDGAKALTMRALAAEAGCALGLPYKVFGGRDELVAALVDEQFQQMAVALDAVVAAAGSGTVAENLLRFAEVLLGSEIEVIKLVDLHHEPDLTAHLEDSARTTGFLDRLTTTIARYVAAEKKIGRVAKAVDEEAVGFLVTGAIHNLLVSGAGYPRPVPGELARYLASLAVLLGADQAPLH